ncbi:hypothetical protein C7974DRAFT_59593 [Boeremia exigua]|uniref:uncharacterized protein n=1 Tax=Boeremia exigua TaxID=749465 RepID=UPI001E8CD854|nr:uncharacterized protein C7974DRAFT_59593 [Boeremia exigua]KAH6615119.1 hypothetical protein C7974DRAFT_59593 [Boeremia exigua]
MCELAPNAAIYRPTSCLPHLRTPPVQPLPPPYHSPTPPSRNPTAPQHPRSKPRDPPARRPSHPPMPIAPQPNPPTTHPPAPTPHTHSSAPCTYTPNPGRVAETPTRCSTDPPCTRALRSCHAMPRSAPRRLACRTVKALWGLSGRFRGPVACISLVARGGCTAWRARGRDVVLRGCVGAWLGACWGGVEVR